MLAPASHGGNLPKYLYSSEAHDRRRRDYEKRRALGCSQGSTHRQARYQLRPSAAFAQVIECAGTCITRRLQEGTSTGLRAGKCPPTGQVPRQPSAAFTQGPDTRAPAFAEPSHKQRGLAHAAKTSCELHAGQRRLTDGLRVRTDGQRQCRPTGAATSSTQRHQHKVVNTSPSQRRAALRTKALGRAFVRKHSVVVNTSPSQRRAALRTSTTECFRAPAGAQ